MLPWTRSRWFRRAVTGVSTAFVVVVLATSLLAEGSPLKRHPSRIASVKFLHGKTTGRSRPEGGCEGRAILIQPKSGNRPATVKVDYAALAREISRMPRFTMP